MQDWVQDVVSIRGKIGDALDEFEELRRADNCVWV
jgi:hypothetical protein